MGQAAAAGGSSMLATGLSMYGTYVSSRGQAAGDQYKAELLDQQAQYGELKATQTNAQMTRNLAITLGHIDAVRGAMHTDPTSPTGAAVRGATEQMGAMKKEITVENIEQQARTDEENAAYMRSQASNALLSGDIAMAGQLFGGAAGALKPGGGGGGISGTPDPASPYTTGAPY